ncbi:MAG: hypothetical protein WCG60_01820, partial [bacterium]
MEMGNCLYATLYNAPFNVKSLRLKNNNEWESFNYDDKKITVIKEIIEPLFEKIKNGLDTICPKEIQN